MNKYFYALPIELVILSGCAIKEARYLPDGDEESNLATLQGSGPRFLKFVESNSDDRGTPYWVSIKEVFDENGAKVITPNSWSGSYERVLLPSGKYLVYGGCWMGEIFSRYELAVELDEGHKYQVNCFVGKMKKDGFWTTNYTAKTILEIKDITETEEGK